MSRTHTFNTRPTVGGLRHPAAASNSSGPTPVQARLLPVWIQPSPSRFKAQKSQDRRQQAAQHGLHSSPPGRPAPPLAEPPDVESRRDPPKKGPLESLRPGLGSSTLLRGVLDQDLYRNDFSLNEKTRTLCTKPVVQSTATLCNKPSVPLPFSTRNLAQRVDRRRCLSLCCSP